MFVHRMYRTDDVDQSSAADVASACYSGRAKCCFQDGHFAECAELCTLALQLQPYSWEALYVRGQVSAQHFIDPVCKGMSEY